MRPPHSFRCGLVAGLWLAACASEPVHTPVKPLVSSVPSASAPVVIPSSPSSVASVSAPPPTPPSAPDPCPDAPEDMACIPGGAFTRGIDSDSHRCIQGGQPTGLKPTNWPAANVIVSTFLIDKTEVTVAAYRKCVDDKKGCPDVRPLYFDFDGPEQPMTGVSWYDADAFCRAMGKRLPTEAEWEKAARGPDGAATPYADPISCDNAVVEDDRGRSCGVKKRGGDADKGKVLPVKSKPAGRFGLFDMMGNAEEWVADWWTKSYDACGDACAGTDPKGPCGGGADACAGRAWKVVRGGSWYWPAEHATGYHRRRHYPANKPPGYHHFGFRCARTP